MSKDEPRAAPEVGSDQKGEAYLALVTLVFLLGATAIVLLRPPVRTDNCSSGLVEDDVPMPLRMDSLAPVARLGTGRPGVMALGEFEVIYVPRYHRFGDTDEIGWHDVKIRDPSSCSGTPIPLRGEGLEGPFDRTIRLSRDIVDDVYVVHNDRFVFARFRKVPARSLARRWEVRHEWPSEFVPPVSFDILSGAMLSAGVVNRLRSKPAGALLALSLLLAFFGALFGLAVT